MTWRGGRAFDSSLWLEVCQVPGDALQFFENQLVAECVWR